VALGVNQTRMTAGLTQAQQCLQHLDLGFCQALDLDPLQQPVPVVLAELVVAYAGKAPSRNKRFARSLMGARAPLELWYDAE
jgi:hypothetical protein